MIQWSELVKSLNTDDLSRLHSAVYDEVTRRNKQDATRMEDPTKTELELLKVNYIQAIKSYRTRTGCGLVMAKYVMDRFR